MMRLSGGRALGGLPRLVLCPGFYLAALLASSPAHAAAPDAGGDVTATSPGGGPVAIAEDAPAPGSANIRITPVTLNDPDMGETPDSIRFLSITGGTVSQGDGNPITLGASGTVLMLSGGNYDARFTPTADRDIDATIQYVVVDPGGMTDSTQSAVTITITASDDDPPAAGGNVTATNTGGGATSIAEDAAAPGAANIRVTPMTLSDPDTADDPPNAIRLLAFTGGTVSQSDGSAITLGAAGTVLSLASGNLDLRFTPTMNRDTDVTIPYVVVDPSSVSDSPSSTITVAITAGADPPSAGGDITATNTGGGAISIAEDAAAPGAANIRVTPSVLSDPDTGETPNAIRLLSFTGGTVAQSDGSAITLGAAGTVLSLSGGGLNLRFTPTMNRDTDVTIPYVVVDPAMVSDSASSTITVTISSSSDPPTAGGNITATNTSGGAISILEDAPAPGAANIRVTPSVLSDPDSGETPNSIRLMAFTGGTVAQANGSAITLGAAGTVLTLSGGSLDLRFTPASQRDTNVIIPYVVVDPGGMSDSTQSNITINITAGADPPSAGGDVVATNPAGGATDIDEDDPAPGAANVRITPVTLNDVDTGETPNSLRLISVTGGSVTQSNGSAITLGASGTVLVLSGGNLDLRFTPTAQQDTAATIVYVVVDPGGISDSAPSNVTVNISSSPDAPSPGGNITATSPGGGATTITEDDPAPGAANIRVTPMTLADNDTGETPNAIRLLSFTGGTVLQGNGSAIVLGPAGTVLTLSSGNLDLRFTPAGNRDTAVTIPYVVVDPGGVSDSASSNITVNITAVNDAPSAANATLADIMEDDTNPPGATVTSLFGGSFSDVDGTFAGIAVVGNPQSGAEGVWQYSPPTSPGSQWFPVGSVTDTAVAPNALVLGPTTLLRFVPTAQFDGAVTSLTIRVLDDTYGGSFSTRTGVTQNRVTLNTSTNGDPTAISGGSLTITHNVTSDNDTPSVVQNNTLSLNQGDAGTITSALLSFTDVDDDDTTLLYTIVSGPSNGSLSITPTFTQANVNANSLSYTHNGSNTTSDSFSFNVRDDGGAITANATFTIAINLTPTVTAPIADVQVNENAANTVINLLASFDDNEDGAGGLTYTVQSTSGDAIFAGAPAIAGSNLTLSYAPDSPGSNTVTIRATDSDGDFVQDTFQVNVNDRPEADDDSANTSEGNAIAISVLTGDTDSDGTLVPSSVSVTAAASNGTTMVNSGTGVVTYTPTGDFNGVDTFQYTVADNLGAVSAAATVTVTVSAVNDPPGLTVPGATQNVAEGGTLTISTAQGNPITITDIDADETALPTGGVTVSIGATKGTLTLATTTNLIGLSGNGTSTVVFSGTIADTANALNGLVYSPNAMVNGAETITVNVSDNGNTGSGGVMTQMDTIDVSISATNDPPVVTVPGAQTINEDVTTGIAGISIADPDAGSGAVTVTLSVVQGTIGVNAAASGGVPSGDISGNNSNTVSLNGTLTQLNNTLPTVTFRSSQNLVTTQTLTVTANDNGNSGGAAETDSETVSITITPQNDNPTFSNFPGSAQAINEDTTLQFSTANGNRITLSDVDVEENNPTGTIRATLAVGNGTLTLSGTAGLASVSGNGTALVVLEGPIASVNAALNGLAYLGTQHFNGADSLTATINDLGNTGAGGGGNVVNAVTINVAARNDAPLISVPAAQSVNENTNLPFSGTDGNAISVADADSDEAPGELVVTLTVTQGTLTLANTAGLSANTGDTTASVSITGSLTAVNNAIDGLVYRGNLDFNGTDTLTITANDQGNTGGGAVGIDSETVSITVDAVNNAPQLTLPGGQTINEDATAGIAGISVTDVDAGANDLLVTLSVGAGMLHVDGGVSGGVPTLDIGTNNSSTVTLTGTLSELNTTLPTLTFTSAQNNRNNQTLTVTADDQGNTGSGGNQTDSGTVTLSITALNDDPELSLPTAQTINEEASLIFATSNGNAVTVSDVDVAEAPGQLRITLTVSHGQLTLGTTGGITLLDGTGTNDTTVTFRGTATAVNTAMGGMTYQPDQHFNTEAGLSESLEIIVNDQGNTGLGGGTDITGSVAINVLGLNDNPSLSVPGAQVVDEDTDLVFNGSITASDIDVAESSGDLEIDLSATRGVFTLATTAGVDIDGPADGAMDGAITFRGTASEVNAALNGLIYRGEQDFNGADTITVTVNDLGNTGQGGGIDVTRTIPVTVSPVNDPPVASNVVLSPAEPLRNENLTASYTYSDVDSDPQSGTTIRWFRDGVLQSAFNNLTTVPMSATVEEEVWFFRVVPNDGLVAGAEVQSNSVNIRPVADLQLSISRDPAAVVPGESVTYTFQVRNLGPSPVNGASVTTALPPALLNPTWTCDCGTNGSGDIGETLDLASGQTVLYNLTALVDAAATGDLAVTATVQAPALVFELDAANNTDTDSVPLMPEANLSVTMSADRDTAQPGDLITYTVTATNTGPSDARGVLFADTPDSNTTLSTGSISAGQGTVTSGNGAGDTSVSVDVGTIALGATVEISYSVSVDNPFPASGLREVCTRGRFFPDSGNPESNFVDAEPPADSCTTIDSIIDLSATKTAALLTDLNGDGGINPGDTLRYTVSVVNSGDGGANNVTFTSPAIANGILIVDSISVTPPATNVMTSGGAITINLGNVEGTGAGTNTATITYDVRIQNPIASGESILVSQGEIVYDEIPDVATPILTDNPGAVAIDGSDAVPVDANGDVIHPAPTAIQVIAAPVLVVQKADDIERTEEKRPGDTIAYTVSIENKGNQGASGLVFRVPFKDGEISEAELNLVDGDDPLVDLVGSLLTNFDALDADDSGGLSSQELAGSFFALTTAQFNQIDTSDARLSLDEGSITVDGVDTANEGTASELVLSLDNLNGRNPLFTNGPMTAITFTVTLEPVLPQGVSVILCQGTVESNELDPVVTDDPESVNVIGDATRTSVRAIPELSIVPEILTIDFGDQDIDDGPTQTRMVELTNSASATANLTFSFVDVEGVSLSEFIIVSDTEEDVLIPGQTRFIELAFDPESIGNKRASLRVESDDPDDAAVDVNLSGRALDSDIRVTPGSLDFGKRNLLAGPSNPQSVSIINDGLGILTLDSVSLACGPDIFPVMTESRFNTLDRNGDGVLTFGIGAQELELAVDLFETAEVLIDEFDALDTDNSQDLTADEIDVRLPFLTPERYSVLDSDGAGDLSQGELDNALRLAGFADGLLASFEDFDVNPPAGLDYDEAQSILPDITVDEFAVLDGDADEVLSRGELDERQRLSLIAMQLQTDFFGLDANRDELLSQSEINTFVPLLTPGRFGILDADMDEEVTIDELNASNSTLAESILPRFTTLDTDASGGLTIDEINATCAFSIQSDSGEDALETAQSRLVRIVFNPSTAGIKVGTLRIEANQSGQGTPIVEKVSLFGIGNRTPRITGQNPVTTTEDTPVTIILDNLIVDAPLLDFPDEVSLAFQPRPADANYTRDGNEIIPNLNFNGVLFVPVTVRDGDIDSNIWNLRIDVSRVNDGPTSMSLSNNTIMENQVLDTVIGQLSTTDPDIGDLHIYSLVPDDPTTDDDDFIDNEYFGIVANQLVSRVVFDYETEDAYTVLVRSRDPEGLSIQRAFEIQILDQPNDEDNAVSSEVLLENFADVDANGDGSLSFEETLRLLPGFTRERFDALNTESEISFAELEAGAEYTAAAQPLFDNFDVSDVNGNGLLSLAEARRRVPGMTQAGLDYLDLDGSGTLSPSELQVGILLFNDLNELINNFDSYDADGSGSLTIDELPSSMVALDAERFTLLEANAGLSRRELETQVTCMLVEGSVVLIQPSGDIIAPPGAALQEVTFNAEVGVNIQSVCRADDVEFTYDIGAESILITDLAEYFLQNLTALDANFDGALAEDEVSSSRIGLTTERFGAIDFNGNLFLSVDELEAAVILSDLATLMLDEFAAINADNSTGLSFAEVINAGVDIDQLRYNIIDLNKNAVLTRQELEAEADLPGYLLANFTTLDGNADEGLSIAEIRVNLPGLSMTRFANLDANADGFVTANELLSADDFQKANPLFAEWLPLEGVQKQLRGTQPATFTLPVNNAYRVRVTATLPETGQVEQSEEFTFEIRNGLDSDDNGYLDFPFEDLVNDGSRWQRVVTSANCNRRVLMHGWQGANIPGRNIEATLVNPANSAQQLTLVVPHGLATDGEEAILIAAISCDAESLFTRQRAGDIAQTPEDIVGGSAWVSVEIIVREAGAPVFAPLSETRLGQRPITMTLNRLSFSPEDDATFFRHETQIISNETTGLDVIPVSSDWTAARVSQPASSGNTLSARVSQLGTFVAIESLKPPILVTVPDISVGVNFGEIALNETVEIPVTITNIGGERLIGNVELRDSTGMFSLIGNASYNLAHAESLEFLVRFSPTVDAEFAATLAFTGDPKGTQVTDIEGVGMAPKGFFGCAAMPSGGSSPWSSIAVILVTTTALAFARRRTSAP